MTLEGALVLALSITSTTAVGLDLGGTKRQTTPTPLRATLLILLGNVVVPPACAWLAVRALDLGTTGAGVILAAAVPGGSTGPLLATLADGDVRVATRWFVILMSIGTVVALLATLTLAPGGVWRVLQGGAVVFAVSAVPLVGAREAATRGWIASRWAKAAARASLVLLVATVGLLLVRHVAHADARSLGASALVVATGVAVAPLVRLPGPAQRAVVEVGLVRNLTLALVVMEVVGAPPAARVAALGYGLMMYLAATGMALWTRYAARR